MQPWIHPLHPMGHSKLHIKIYPTLLANQICHKFDVLEGLARGAEQPKVHLWMHRM